jgi:hypothetical protein
MAFLRVDISQNSAAANDGKKFPIYLYSGLLEYGSSILCDGFEPMSG